MSGTNAVHGAGFEFLRNSALDARNYFDRGGIPEFQRNQFGGSLGGPLRKDRLFLFGNYEGFRQNWGLSAVTLVPDDEARRGYLPDASGTEQYAGVNAAVAPLLALWPAANGPELGSGIAEAFSHPEQHIREDFGTTRFDANLTSRDLLFAVYTVDDSAADTPTQNPLSRIDERLREQVASVQEQHTFSARLLNTARFGYSRASYVFNGYSPVAVPGWVTGKPVGAIVISGSTASNGSSQITQAGTNVGSNNVTARNLFTGDDHIYYSRGNHHAGSGRVGAADPVERFAGAEPVRAGFVQHAEDVFAGDGGDVHGGAVADGAGVAIAGGCGVRGGHMEGEAATGAARGVPVRVDGWLE